MKILIAFAAATSLLLTQTALADDSHHPEKARENKTATAKTSKPSSAKTESSDQSMMAMQDRMQQMRDLMEKIQAAADPAERQKLLQEHMQMMRDGMKMMSSGSSGSRGGMTMGMTGDAEMGKGLEKGGSEHCSMMNDHGMMGKRMDMMQMMMGQMMDHQKAVESPPK